MKGKETENLYNSLTNVDDRLIQEASELPGVEKKMRFGWRKWGVLAACLCVVAASVYISRKQPQGGGGIKPGSTQTEHLADPNAEPDDIVCIYMGDIFVNELSDQQVSPARPWRDPALYEKVVWDEKAVEEYYGRNLTPAYVPEGLIAAPDNGRGWVYLQKSNHKLVEDDRWLGFYHAYHEDGSPKLTDNVAACKGFELRASKMGLLKTCLYLLPENEVKTSNIGGTEVTFGYRPMSYGPYDPQTREPAGVYDLYVAEFKLQDIAYQIVAEQMELDEVVKVVASIIFGENTITVEAA